MPGLVYILCAITSLACALLLFRGYHRSAVRLLLWSSICFAGLAIDNVLLYLDNIIFPDMSLNLYRKLPGMLSLAVLLFGLVWESD